MRFIDYIKLAIKNLTRRKLRTFLTISAVIIGAVAVTTLISIGQNVGLSFKDMINNLGILNMVTVSPDQDNDSGGMLNTGGGDTTGGKKITDETIVSVKKLKYVLDATPTTSLWFESMQLKEGNGKKIRASILAVDTETKAYPIDVSAGRSVNKSDMGKIVIGSGNLKALGYADKPEEIIGKKLLLNTKGWYSGWGADVPKPPQEGNNEEWWKEQEQRKQQVEVEIVGVATPSGDDWQNFTNMEWGRAVQSRREWRQNEEKRTVWEEQQRSRNNGNFSNKMPDLYELITVDELAKSGYNALIVKVDDAKNTETVATEVKKLGYGASTAKEMIDEIMRLIKILTNILAAIGGVSLIVAAIGIINTMAMAIFERRKEIGVMRACGATRATVRRLFTFEAALIGLLGGSIGLGITYGLALIGDWATEQFSSMSSIPIKTFVYFPYWLAFGVIGFTTVIGLFAGLYPAFKAARLSPVDALKQQ